MKKMLNNIYNFLRKRIEMTEEQQFLEDRLKTDKEEIRELSQVMDLMYEKRMYKEMLPILNQIKVTAPEVYQAYYQKAERAYQYKQKQERMMQ